LHSADADPAPDIAKATAAAIRYRELVSMVRFLTMGPDLCSLV
jgi:hypothetical protein